VEPQTETVWRQANEYHVPRVVFANKMDKTGADFAASIITIHNRLGAKAEAIQWPIGAEDSFDGIIDIVALKAYHFDGGPDENYKEISIPANLKKTIEERRTRLIEAVADFDESLMVSYLDGDTITEKMLKSAVRKATLTVEFSQSFADRHSKTKV